MFNARLGALFSYDIATLMVPVESWIKNRLVLIL